MNTKHHGVRDRVAKLFRWRPCGTDLKGERCGSLTLHGTHYTLPLDF